MAFIDTVLHTPSYGWQNDQGELIVPTKRQLFKEAFSRLNFFRTKKNWISAISWVMVFCMLPFFYLFLFKYFSLPLLGAFLLYSMIIMSTHGTIWFHRYCTHKAYTFSHPIFRFITQNLVLRTFPEEIYVVSHHVHHSKSDLPGDPYNAQAGLWYCMLSDVNHQTVARDISEADYGKVLKFMDHTGVKLNNYQQFQKWGSVASPFYTIGLWILNWAFWYSAFFLLGGHALACALFSAGMFWFVLVRAFNYNGHGKGEVAHKEGVDFDRSNLSINQTRTGLFSGEWHNNHHLFPGSARAGFLRYQIDPAWIYIWTLHKLGMVSSYRDSKKQFFARYPEALSKRKVQRSERLKTAVK
jgi:stearoyl-CoA desaturase (delta-9 desaturase)